MPEDPAAFAHPSQLLCLPSEAATDLAPLEYRLPPGCSLLVAGSFRGRFEVWDSFDWRLWYKAKSLLLRRMDHWWLISRKGYGLVPQAPNGSAARGARWPDAFTAHSGGRRLGAVLGPRALIEVASYVHRESSFWVLDANQKKIARLSALELRSTAPSPPFFSGLVLHPLLGYQRETQGVCDALSASGYQRQRKSPVLALLETQGKAPFRYTPKPRLALKPALPARTAVDRVIATQLKIMQANAFGIEQDIDPEFLHDYRIALRAARAVLALLPSVYDTDQVEPLRNELRSLQQQTNHMRDLDVWIAEADSRVAVLPDALSGAGREVFAALAEERAVALKTVRSHLQAPQYRGRLEALARTFGTGAPDLAGADAEAPIVDLVQREVRRRYRKLREATRAGLPATDEALHRLRVQCKKLRYLLEVFAAVLPAESAAGAVKALRRLQNALGEYNDLRLREDALQDLVFQGRLHAPEAVFAAGLLAGVDLRDKAYARETIADALAGFNCGSTKACFRELSRATH